METILVAEDEPEVRNYLGTALGCHGYAVEFAQDGDEALQYVRAPHNKISLLLLDIVMPCKDGFQALEGIREIRPDLPVIMLSGASSASNIVRAMKAGAVDFVTKPVYHQELCAAVQRALPPSTSRSAATSSRPKSESARISLASEGWSQKIETLVQKVGSSDVPVLLQGETGVGKEVLARKLHAQSPRAGRPFLKLNCAALPSELVESELFGYDRGAFTGAFKSTPGKFEMANGGTILLDEIGDMDFRIQAKLLQVLQDREFLRLGANEVSKVDVRVMAATHTDLEKAIAEGRFRQDLYYRLNVITIHMPPLRDRPDEILQLADYFIQLHATHGDPPVQIPPVLRDALLEYRWPGNVRELENVMRRYLVLRNPEALARDLLLQGNKARFAVRPNETRSGVASVDPPQDAAVARSAILDQGIASDEADESSILKKVDSAHKAAEADVIVAALNAALWNRKKAAASLNIDYKALLYKMKRLGIGESKRSAATA
jgi:two-component system response regulator AtoC